MRLAASYKLFLFTYFKERECTEHPVGGTIHSHAFTLFPRREFTQQSRQQRHEQHESYELRTQPLPSR